MPLTNVVTTTAEVGPGSLRAAIYYATNNTISGCWFGLDDTGSNAAPNAYQGILIFNGAGGNIIGGANALARNAISGFFGYGVHVDNVGAPGNWIGGNDIGTDATATNSPFPFTDGSATSYRVRFYRVVSP